MNVLIKKSINSHYDLIKKLDNKILHDIENASKLIIKTFEKNRKVLWCGNGGSASQANHLSAELVGGMYKVKKDPFKSICLNSDIALITAWSNDKSFDGIFSRQLEALGEKGDLLILLSTSGNSTNLIQAAKEAVKNNIKVVSLTGNNGGSIKNISDVNINVESQSTQRIQELHILFGHIICDIIENHYNL